MINVVRPVLLNRLILFYGGAMAMTAMSIENNLSECSQFFAVGLADAVALQTGILFGEIKEDSNGLLHMGRNE